MPKQVILIMTDSQRKDMVGCLGSPYITPEHPSPTPQLDRLAAGGARFSRAYTVSPVCGPARSGIFTGTYPHQNGVWANSLALYANVRSVGERLTDEGHHCVYIGKWHLDGGDYFGLGTCPPGWDPAYWYDMRNYINELSESDRVRSRSHKTSQDPDITADFTYAHRCSDRAIDFLQDHGNEDFFLVVSYDEPHHPFIAPQPFADMYKDLPPVYFENEEEDLSDKPAHHQAWAKFFDGNYAYTREEFCQLFLGCNAFVDDEIGRVINAIDAHAQDAMVIYLSDHGEMLFSHQLVKKGPAMYDEIANIPLIVRWPGQTPENIEVRSPASLVDITPTILDYFGAEIPPFISGKSLLNDLKDPQNMKTRTVFMEFGRQEIDHDGYLGFQPIRACFDGRYKLVINLLDKDELYDLKEDPGEMRNLINEETTAAIRDHLHDQIIDWINSTRDPFRGYVWKNRSWRKDAEKPSFPNEGYTRQREESERYEERQLDYATGLTMKEATRGKHAKK
jgi:uncharacterized sulfatase